MQYNSVQTVPSYLEIVLLQIIPCFLLQGTRVERKPESLMVQRIIAYMVIGLEMPEYPIMILGLLHKSMYTGTTSLLVETRVLLFLQTE